MCRVSKTLGITTQFDRVGWQHARHALLERRARRHREHAVAIAEGARVVGGARGLPLVHELALEVLGARERVGRPVLEPEQVQVVPVMSWEEGAGAGRC